MRMDDQRIVVFIGGVAFENKESLNLQTVGNLGFQGDFHRIPIFSLIIHGTFNDGGGDWRRMSKFQGNGQVSVDRDGGGLHGRWSEGGARWRFGSDGIRLPPGRWGEPKGGISVDISNGSIRSQVQIVAGEPVRGEGAEIQAGIPYLPRSQLHIGHGFAHRVLDMNINPEQWQLDIRHQVGCHLDRGCVGEGEQKRRAEYKAEIVESLRTELIGAGNQRKRVSALAISGSGQEISSRVFKDQFLI